MDSANVAQITAPSAAPIQQRSLTRGREKEAEFLSLRLLNKRGRVRLSTQPIDYTRLPGKSSLLAVGNQNGCLAAAVREGDANFILLTTLSEFRIVVESGELEPEPFIPFKPQHPPFKVPGTPNIVKLAFHDERLIVGFVEGPILVYSTSDIYAPARNQVDPIHVFPGDASTIPRDIVPNPGESPELVAILRGVHGQEPGHHVDVIDVQQFKHIAGWRKGVDPNTAPVSISWSPKGKQIAIGLQSGDILSYNPLSAGSPKSHLPRPPSIPPTASSLLSTTWLTNSSFHTIFSSPEACSSLFNASNSSSLTKSHVISTHDAKSQTSVDVELLDPSPPFGAQFPPGPLSIVLRNWSPTKFIIICGDGPSPDIGVVGSLSSDGTPDAWVNFTLEETSTPSLPLGEDTQDMALLGLEIDLTSSKSVRMSEQPDDGTPDLPPSPILYAYMSDGTVVAWHILNTTGNSYPGMVTANSTGASVSSAQFGRVSMDELSMSSPRVSPLVSPKPTPLPTPSQSQPISALPFRQTAASPPSGPSSIAPAQGFGAFGNLAATSKFGSTGFGFAGASAPSAFGTPSTASAFGSSGFGGVSDVKNSQASLAFGSPGFGQPSGAPAFGAPGFGSKPAVPAFGQSGFSSSGSASIPSSGGFAAFANQGPSTFGAPAGSAFSSESKPMQSSPFGTVSSPSGPQSAFGAGGLGQAPTAPTSAFGSGGSGPSTSFGQQHRPSAAFGQTSTTSTFGSPSFGKPAAPAFGQSGFTSSSSPKSSVLSTGGFAAFANKGPSTFGASVGSGFSSESKPVQSSPFGTSASTSGAQSAFGAGGSGQANATPLSAFGAGGSGQSTVTFTSAFGAGSSGQANATPASAFGANVSRQATATPNLASGADGPGQANAAPTSAFGVVGTGQAMSQQQQPAQPSPSAFGISGSESPTPAFGQTGFGTTTASATSPGGAFGNLDALGDSLISSKPPSPAKFGSPPGSPPSPGESPPSSPKQSPTSSQPVKPASSYLKPAEGFGAFVKPSGAFGVVSTPVATGAFASSSQQKSMTSASSQPKPIAPSGSSAASSSTPTPTFGSTSALGRNKPVFGTSTFEAVAETKDNQISKPITGGFEAFSSGGGGLASFTNADKSTSFDDILSSSDQGTPKSVDTPLAFGTPSNSQLTTVPIIKTPAEEVSTADLASASDKASVRAVSPTTAPATEPPLSSGNSANRRPKTYPQLGTSPASAPASATDKATVQAEAVSPTTVPATEAPLSSGNGTASSANRRPKTYPQLGASPAPAPAAGPTTLRGPFVLGQPQALPVPLKASSPPVPLAVPAADPHPPVSPAAREGESEKLPKHPLQIEFQRAYQEMVKELVQLHKKAQEMTIILPVISEPRGLDKLVLKNQDFVQGKYSHGDLKSFTIMIGTLQKKVLPLLDQAKLNKGLLQDLQNLALISETKQEELSRWARAREDPEHAKSLKPRALGPEHLENQIRLRKALQMAHDRIQQCEDEFESLKKRLGQYKSGRVGLRPPSLDTIDRTCRNIQAALEERTKLLEQLNNRMDALSPQTSQRLQSSANQTRMPYQKPGTATPPFASVAAAALNSERSSLKLKNALLSARKEPLLTTNMVKLKTTRSASLGPKVSPQTQRPEWKLPPVPPLSSPSNSVSRRSARPGKKHGAVQLKSSSTPGSDAKPVAFDWGPLPGVAPMAKLSQDVRSQKATSATKLTKQEVDDDGEWDDAEHYEGQQ